MWFLDEVLISKFVIVRAKLLAISSTSSYNPLPKQTHDQKLFTRVPGQWVRPTLLYVRQSHITPITNDVDNQSIRYLAFDFLNVEQMIWSAIRPSLNSLLFGNFLHNNAKEIAGAIAILINTASDAICI